MPIELFYSYAHEDEPLRARLETHLALLRRQGLITAWHDRSIGAGDDWRDQIDTHIRSAQIILLLISADFIASDYCHDIELRLARERHDRGEAIVIPILLRPVDWSGADFVRLQGLPRNALPITLWKNQDEAFRDVALGIRQVIERWGQARPGELLAVAAARREAPRPRVLDAAVPSHIVKDVETELQVLIRLPESSGLRGALQDDDTSEAGPEDVISKEFKAQFPLGADGRPKPLKAKVLVTSPGFDPPRQEKPIEIPPDGDSEVAAFLLIPQRLGKLKLLVELFWLDATWAPRRLLTECVAESSSVPPSAARHIVRLPFEIQSAASPVESHADRDDLSASLPPMAARPSFASNEGSGSQADARATPRASRGAVYPLLASIILVFAVGLGLRGKPSQPHASAPPSASYPAGGSGPVNSSEPPRTSPPPHTSEPPRTAVLVPSCEPRCAGRECGSDGCGSQCGQCGQDEVCRNAECVCVPACSGRACGPDGCGGQCGTCTRPDRCQDGQCACVPQCSGRECGPDGCGGQCGTCSSAQSCKSGQCVSATRSLAGTYTYEEAVLNGTFVPFRGTLTVIQRDPDNYDTYSEGYTEGIFYPVYYRGWWRREGDQWRGATTQTNDPVLASTVNIESTSRIELDGSRLIIDGGGGTRFVLRKKL